MPDDIGFRVWMRAYLQSSLIDQMDRRAAQRVSDLRSLSYDELARVGPEPVERRGSWGAKGRLRTEVKEFDQYTLRVKVLWDVRLWWWPGYYEACEGFYAHPYDGSPVEDHSYR
jgi:hypothetical protein